VKLHRRGLSLGVPLVAQRTAALKRDCDARPASVAPSSAGRPSPPRVDEGTNFSMCTSHVGASTEKRPLEGEKKSAGHLHSKSLQELE
jgi:hypothetical protein